MPEVKYSKRTTGWTKIAFGDVVRLCTERSSDPDVDGFERYIGLEHLDPGDLKVRRWGNLADGVTFTNVFRPGQVLFGKRRAYQRKVAVADFSGVCSGDIYVLEPKSDALLPELLPFICQTDAFFEHAVGTSAGSLSPRTNWESLADFEFALPPIEEQRRMTACLHAADSCAEALRTAIESVSTARASHLNEFFSSQTANYVRLSEAATILAGGTPSRSKQSYWRGERPWASGKDMKVRWLSQTAEQLSDEGWEAATVAPRGATLIVVRGMILAHTFPVAHCVVPVAFNQDLRALVPHKQIDPEYLTLWAEWSGPWFLKRCGESSHGTKRIEGSVLAEALIPVVALDQQLALRDFQHRFLKAVDSLSDRRRHAQDIMTRLLLALGEQP
jgi:type I restriction enzyme S subunit